MAFLHGAAHYHTAMQKNRDAALRAAPLSSCRASVQNLKCYHTEHAIRFDKGNTKPRRYFLAVGSYEYECQFP